MIETKSSGPVHSEAKVRQTFQHLWAKTDPSGATKPDPLSRDIADVLFSLLPNNQRLSILEAGSGTGKISVMLAKAGHDVTLLDTSREALDISRKVFQAAGQPFRALQGSMFRIPVPDSTFDVVWNAGVIEHFYFHEQVEALRELGRVLKPEGALITLNPSARGQLYRLSKYLKEKMGRWRFGQEFPIRTLGPHCETIQFRLVREEEVLGPYQLLYIPYAGVPMYYACRRSRALSQSVTTLLGGYLRLSVIHKPLLIQ